MASLFNSGQSTKTLAIAIPTYNRSQLLDQQLAWLIPAVQRFGAECEIFVSNNCSTDDTAQIIEKWASQCSHTDFSVCHQPRNVGAIRNIANCIRSVSADHVWVLSDDDTVLNGTLAYVIEELHQSPEIGVITLNFAGRNYYSQELVYDRRYPLEQTLYDRQGAIIFEECVRMEGGVGGLALTSAQIYRKDLAQTALDLWPKGLNNIAVQVYVTAYCAQNGGAQVTKDVFIECSLGNHFFANDRATYLKMTYADEPNVYERLIQIGYSKDFCKIMIRRKRGEFFRVFASKKKLLKTFLRHPIVLIYAISQLAFRSL